MRVLAVLFLAICVVQAVPKPGFLQASYDDVNGTVSAERAMTDDDGNTEVVKANGVVDPDTDNDVLPPNPIDSKDGNVDNGVTTVTGSFKQSSTSFTSTIDEDGNEITSGNSDNLFGMINGIQFNDNGNVFGSEAIDVTRMDSTLEGMNGVNDIMSSELNLDE